MAIHSKTRQSLQATGFFYLDRNNASIQLLFHDFWQIKGEQVFHSCFADDLKNYLDPETPKNRFSGADVFSENVDVKTRYEFGSFVLIEGGNDEFFIFDAEKEIK